MMRRAVLASLLLAAKADLPDAEQNCSAHGNGLLQLKASRGGRSAGPVINELLPKAASGSAEWIELYNPTGCPMDLTGWVLRDAADNTLGSLKDKAVPAFGRIVVHFSNKLNNGGDTATLYDPEGAAVDTYTYGSSVAGQSYARVPDGGAWASAAAEASEGKANCPAGSPHGVIINEIMPRAQSGRAEWVELLNRGCGVNLAGWEVLEEKNAKGKWDHKGWLAPGARVLVRYSSRLNNGGDSVILKDSSGAEVDRYKYGKSARGKSWLRLPDGGAWAESQETPSEGSSNGGCDGSVIIAPAPQPSGPSPTPPPPAPLTPAPGPEPCGGKCGNGICFGSFNIQNYGASKSGRPAVLKAVRQVLARYDITAVQELSQMPRAPYVCGDYTEPAICKSRPDNEVFTVAASPRIGDEQYAVMYRNDAAEVVGGETYPDPEKIHSRPPHAFDIKLKRGGIDRMILAMTHTSPEHATEEIHNFPKITDWMEATFKAENNVMAGDYNSDGSYFKDEQEWPDDELPDWPGYTMLSSNDLDTTVAGNTNTYDRVVVSDALATHSGEGIVYRLENLDLSDVYTEGCQMGYVPKKICDLNLSGPYSSFPESAKTELAKEVSDHHPIEVCLA